MLQCGYIVLLTVRFLDVTKNTYLTPLSLLISRKFSFPIVGLKMSSFPTLLLKSEFSFRLLVGKPEGKRPLGRPRHKWADNIKIDLLKIGWGGVDWIGLAQDRDKWRALVNAIMNLRVL
jgi:hypothetical protein